MDWHNIGVVALLAGTVGFFVFAHLIRKNTVNPVKRPKEVMFDAVKATFWLFLLGATAIGASKYYVTESGWYPRTREVVVYAAAANWVSGELKICFSSETAHKNELASLVCDAETVENHTLNVTFWGPITTEEPEVWKCERGQSSLTCKLQ